MCNLMLSGLVCVSCSDKDSQLRSETLQVYTSDSSADLSEVLVAPGGEPDGVIHVLSSETLDFNYESQEDGWLSLEPAKEEEPGHYVIRYSAIPASNSLEERYGVLSITCAEKYLGRFVKLRQGYKLLYKDTFDNLADSCVTLNAGSSVYSTGYIDSDINKTYSDYVTFNAYAVRKSGQSLSFPLRFTVLGGGVMDSTWATDEIVDVGIGTAPGKDNFHYLLISNKGKRMSGDTRFVFSYEEQDNVDICIDNLTVCAVSEDDTAYDPDQDPEEED